MNSSSLSPQTPEHERWGKSGGERKKRGRGEGKRELAGGTAHEELLIRADLGRPESHAPFQCP